MTVRARVAITAAAGVLVLAVAAPASAVVPGANGLIAYFGDRLEVSTVRPDGTGNSRLGAGGYYAAWSPDARRIAYARPDGRGGSNIWVMNRDGSNRHQLTSGRYDTNPSWSPDGRLISYGSPPTGIRIVRTDGTGTSRGIPAASLNPRWSPDGRWIVFDRPGSCERGYFCSVIAKIHPDGTGRRVLFSHPRAQYESPDWSPDGRRIVFASNIFSDGQAGYNDIYTANADGSNPRRLTHDADPGPVRYVDNWPTFSPDGTKIAYNRGAAHLWMMNANGTGQHALGMVQGFRASWARQPTG